MHPPGATLGPPFGGPAFFIDAPAPVFSPPYQLSALPIQRSGQPGSRRAACARVPRRSFLLRHVMSHQGISTGADPESRSTESLIEDARLLAGQRRFGKAVECVSRALEASPDKLDWLAWRAGLLQIVARHAEALADLEQLLAAAPDDETHWQKLAHSLRVMGRLDEAEKALHSALELNSGSVDAMANLGNLYREAGRTAEAVTWLEKAVAAQPDDGELHALLGAALLADGEPARGRIRLQRAFELNPYNRTTLAYLYVALCHTGDARGATELCRPDLLVRSFQREGALPDSPLADDLDRRLDQYVHEHPTLVYERPGNTTRGGVQTGNLLEDSTGPVAELMSWIETQVRAYLASLPMDGSHPYLAWKPEHWDAQAWGVIIRAGGYQRSHLHADGWISGVYYAKVPDAVQSAADNAGGLELGRPTDAFCGDHAFPTRILRPRPGTMHLFPSFLWHRTLPYEADEERTCIAFDIRPHT